MTIITTRRTVIFLPNLVIGHYILEKMIGTPSRDVDTFERLAEKEIIHINQHAAEKLDKHEVIMNVYLRQDLKMANKPHNAQIRICTQAHT